MSTQCEGITAQSEGCVSKHSQPARTESLRPQHVVLDWSKQTIRGDEGRPCFSPLLACLGSVLPSPQVQLQQVCAVHPIVSSSFLFCFGKLRSLSDSYNCPIWFVFPWGDPTHSQKDPDLRQLGLKAFVGRKLPETENIPGYEITCNRKYTLN